MLKHLLLFEICAHEICEKFAYKHSETTEWLTLKKKLASARVKIFLGTWISDFCFKCQVEDFHDDCILLTKWLFVKILEKNYCCT